jgi:hypothetical protein
MLPLTYEKAVANRTVQAAITTLKGLIDPVAVDHPTGTPAQHIELSKLIDVLNTVKNKAEFKTIVDNPAVSDVNKDIKDLATVFIAGIKGILDDELESVNTAFTALQDLS